MTDANAERGTGWRRTESGSLASDAVVKRLIDACVRMGRFQPHNLLRWLVDDVLAGFGLRTEAPLHSDAIPWLRENTALYAEAVIRHPFGDVLGMVYQPGAVVTRAPWCIGPVLHTGERQPADR